MATHPITVAVAICTRDRTVPLERALLSLRDLRERPEAILVIDNAPRSEDTRLLVARAFPEVRYIREQTPGLDFARNRALREASQGVVAFLDDDVVVEPDWLSEIRHVFAMDPSVGLCTGRVGPLFMETAGQRLFEANGGFARGEQRIELPAAEGRRLHGLPAPLIAWSISVGSGCSLAVRRAPALERGGFDEALDLGETLPGGGDLDMIWRMARSGHRVVYEPRVRALHEHRESLQDTVRQILGHNRSVIVLLDKAVRTTRGVERLSVIGFLVWRLLKPLARLLKKAVGQDPLPLSALVRLPWACWRGLGSYPRMQRIARERVRGSGPSADATVPSA